MSVRGLPLPGSPPDPAVAPLSELRSWFEACLPDVLPPLVAEPRELHLAMSYSCEAGKRMRPMLCLAAAAACGGDLRAAVAPAAALELIHAYSLVHDDLPAMDDDSTRRGRPTVHVRFGEALAILAGDALLTLAFGTLAAPGGGPGDPDARLAMVRELAMAAGSLGMVGGQAVDVAAGGEDAPDAGPDLEAKARYIAEHKTGALIRTSCRLGGIAAAAPPALMGPLTRFGATFGFAYQVLDDIGDAQRDRERGAVLNFALLLGDDSAAGTAARAIDVARASLAGTAWPGSARWLEMILDEVGG